MQPVRGTDRDVAADIRALLALIVALGLFLLSVPAATADEDTVLLRDDVGCEVSESQARALAYPPRAVTSSAEEDIAYWRPTLARWDGNDWVQYRVPGDWVAYAYILPGGINQGTNPGWRHMTGHGQLLFFPFPDLPTGEYMVFHEVSLTQSGTAFQGWSSQRCVVR